MKELNPQQKRKAKRLVKFTQNKDRAVFDDLNFLEDSILELKDLVANLKLEKGDKGDSIQGEQGGKGEVGEKGDKGDTGERGADGLNGKNGRDGKDGKDGRDGLDGKDGRNGIDGKDGINGKDGSPDDLNSLRKKLDPVFKEIYEGLRGKNYGGFIETQVKAGSNVSVSKDASGAWVVSSTASGGGSTPITLLSGGLGQGTFVWASAPNIIFIDGVATQKTSVNGTSNWTGTTTTVLQQTWPTQDIFAI